MFEELIFKYLGIQFTFKENYSKFFNVYIFTVLLLIGNLHTYNNKIEKVNFYFLYKCITNNTFSDENVKTNYH